MSHRQAGATGSNASSPSSANAVKNWIAKNGLPPVFSCTSCAKGRARSGSQCRASATSRPTSSSPRGASTISCTLASGLADRLERPQERVRGADLVVPVGPDQQQVPHLRVRDQVLEEVERRCIQPLQIVEEQRERVLLAREHAEEAPEHHLEAVLRILRRQVRDRRLFPDHELQLGNEVDDELTVRAQRLAQSSPATGRAPPRSGPGASGQGSGRPGPGWRTGCRACTGRTCRTRTGRAAGRAPCAARSPPRTCRCRNSRRRARAPGVPFATTRSKAASSASISRSRP